MNVKFYECEICGKIIALLDDPGTPTICCGQEMKELIPNRTDAAFEKHVPVIKVEGNKIHVNVGSEPHPMIEKHYIKWIALLSGKGLQMLELKAGDEPRACFSLGEGDCVKEVFAYCNLHGLWSAKAD